MPSAITVKTPVYEGPLDLLLEMIEKRKLLINDVTLSSIADDFIAETQAMGAIPVDEASEFISLAATLLLIKSRSLLPSLILSPEENQNIAELQYRLAVYQLIKEAARELHTLRTPYLWDGFAPEQSPLFHPDSSITIANIQTAARGIIDAFPVAAVLPRTTVATIVSLEEMIERLAERVSSAAQLSFKTFSRGATDKREVIVGFLALLELVKQGIIRATQEEHFSDITLHSDVVSVPSYE